MLKNRFIVSALYIIVFSSCQKVVNIKLNSATSNIVIEGSINNQSSLDTVKLSKTVNYNQDNTFPSVSGALVTISDNMGDSETLVETSPGIYTGNTLQGIVGRTYTLRVVTEGQAYTGVSTMPAPVNIDSIKFSNNTLGSSKIVSAYFTDPADITNYYRFVLIINHTWIKNVFQTNDNLLNGKNIEYDFRGGASYSLNTGDSVTVQLQSIDKDAYNYFRTLALILNNGSQSTAPANPISNISNNALGYFSAYSVTTKSGVVQ